MISNFFLTLISYWIVNPKKESACREAIDFYYWIESSLKKSAFLPGIDMRARAWRLAQLKKGIKKMPDLSKDFFAQLDMIEDDRPKDFDQHRFEFLSIKRYRVRSFVDFLRTIETESQIESLRAALLPSSEGAQRKSRK